MKGAQLLAKIMIVGLLLAVALPSLRSACRGRTPHEAGELSPFGEPQRSPPAETEPAHGADGLPTTAHQATPSRAGGTASALRNPAARQPTLSSPALTGGLDSVDALGADHDRRREPGPTERLRVIISDCRHDRGVVTIETGRGTLILQGDAFVAPDEVPGEPERRRHFTGILRDLVDAMEGYELVCLELAGAFVVRIWPCEEFDR
ncbi:hypothetical protein JXA88_06415 [Candidatus Fermentibacteria bacterium]|nr:hypothetical protein [Candidatus Fermentibacteria bacterium]